MRLFLRLMRRGNFSSALVIEIVSKTQPSCWESNWILRSIVGYHFPSYHDSSFFWADCLQWKLEIVTWRTIGNFDASVLFWKFIKEYFLDILVGNIKLSTYKGQARNQKSSAFLCICFARCLTEKLLVIKQVEEPVFVSHWSYFSSNWHCHVSWVEDFSWFRIHGVQVIHLYTTCASESVWTIFVSFASKRIETLKKWSYPVDQRETRQQLHVLIYLFLDPTLRAKGNRTIWCFK